MKMKLILKRTSVAAAVAIALGVPSAKAIVIPTNPVNSGDEIGKVVPGSPANPGDETTYLQNTLNLYDFGTTPPDTAHTYTLSGVNFGPLPATVNNETGQIAENSTSFTLDLGAGGLASSYQYLEVKWDDVDVFYDVIGLTGNLTVTNDVVFNKNGQPQAASHAVLFNATSISTVPDGGATALMLGAALLGIGCLARSSRTGAQRLAFGRVS